MATPDQIRAVFETYAKAMSGGDVETIVSLYTEDASIEDPLGAELRVGHDALREFYTLSAGSVKMEVVGPICVGGHEAAAPLLITMGGGTPTPSYIDVIDVMTFAEDGRITSMRAFWSPGDIRQN